MSITAEIIADSISNEGIRITTMQLRYPRFIHSEFMTHRVFSRNASSSRAIPVERMIEDLRRDPAMPVHWGKNQKGMQADLELSPEHINMLRSIWLNSMENAIHSAEKMVEVGLHKQIANRILEPWAHINVVVTATEWNNFFELRRHPDAQPEIHELADRMWDAMQNSCPQILTLGHWHVPYVTNEEIMGDLLNHAVAHELDTWNLAIKVSVARCARVSYLTHDGRQTTIKEDLALYDRLVNHKPGHWSPAEHQATPDNIDPKSEMMAKYGGWEVSQDEYENRNQWGNFTGWRQFRKILEGEQE